MQQTDKYQLNLIETSDTFSPAPLNENAQKLEAALQTGLAAMTAHADAGDAAEAAARAADVAALDQRVQAVEGRILVVGSAPAASGTTTHLGFKPRLLLAVGNGLGLVINGSTSDSGLHVTEDGFTHTGYFASCSFAAFS